MIFVSFITEITEIIRIHASQHISEHNIGFDWFSRFSPFYFSNDAISFNLFQVIIANAVVVVVVLVIIIVMQTKSHFVNVLCPPFRMAWHNKQKRALGQRTMKIKYEKA